MTVYGARQSIYKVEQDQNTLEVTFYVYERAVERERAERVLTNDELYEILLEKARDYKEVGHE